MVKGFTYFVQFLILLPVLVDLLLLTETLLGQFPDLHFVVARVEQLPLIFFYLHPQHFHFLRQPLDFDRLEHHNKLDVVPQVSLPIVGQILDAGSA